VPAAFLFAVAVIVVIVVAWAVITDLGYLGGSSSGGLSWEGHGGGALKYVSHGLI
jgi:hypothetical protein